MSTYLCQAKDVVERGNGFAFRVYGVGRIWPAFLIRFGGEVRAYLNVCAHVGLRLEAGTGNYFCRDGERLVCKSHGATYAPDTGLCTDGPCKGLSLIALNVEERDGLILYEDKDYEYYE
ncbi:Rieske 2Fe-2S domain-containing protein [Sneathiella sp. CAU 1612]|uniref:Rieske 2Fe-2S domain-containing protein n=1 Tax=Sneathiella sedimenti TaxID=2816034 RepID=A0ABS3F6S6_9PROT|nr:Rieske 2Fe-2S domain-containing protein [Sneathiella sedimenti]